MQQRQQERYMLALGESKTVALFGVSLWHIPQDQRRQDAKPVNGKLAHSPMLCSILKISIMRRMGKWKSDSVGFACGTAKIEG